MRRTWIHPEYSIVGRVADASSLTGLDIRPHNSSQQINSLMYFLILSLAALFFGAAIILVCSAHPQLAFSGFDKDSFFEQHTFDKATIMARWKNSFFGNRDAVKQPALQAQANKLGLLILKSGHVRDLDSATELAQVIVTESSLGNYDPFFIAAVIKHESGFNRHAVSRVGAQGLMQIMPDTGRYVASLNGERWLGWWRLRDAQYNIRLGIAYLKQLEKQFKGNKELALIAYNWGPNNLISASKGKARVPSSSLRYARGIITLHRKWQKSGVGGIAEV